MTAQPDPNTTGIRAALAAKRGGRKVFKRRKFFVATAFATRLTEVLEIALETGQWMLVAAQSGDGKSWALRRFVAAHPRTRDANGVAKVPVLQVRTPKKDSQNALMLAMAARLGAVPALASDRFRGWFVQACFNAGVQLIVIDDAHELSDDQLSYLRELTDQLEDRDRHVTVVLLAGTYSLDPEKLDLWRRIQRDDIVAFQFERRLDGSDPLVLITSMTRREVRAVLAAFERVYRDEFPSLHLAKWATSMFNWLTDPRIDRAKFGLARMDPLCKIVHAALADATYQGLGGVGENAELLQAAALRLALRGKAYSDVTGDPEADGDAGEAAA